jgi:2-polyprenyl-6-methoxyphenol hydroxylase-like FAD-dependent oxidoreductase
MEGRAQQSQEEPAMRTETLTQQDHRSELIATENTPGPQHVHAVACCVVGGGPAGVVLALLLARQGVEVLLLEAHHDFDRDFRGDTVRPSTLELLEQLDLLDRLLKLPHAKVADVPIHYPDGSISTPSRSPVRAPLRARFSHSVQVPQARFLELLVNEAQRYPTFHLVMGARVEHLVEQDGVVRGVRYRAGDAWHEVRAALVVGADGRFSRVRQLAGLSLEHTDHAIDVLWLRLPHGPADPDQANGIYLGEGGHIVVLDRGDTWQIGYAFPKGGYQRLRSDGLEALRGGIAERVPWLADRVDLLQDWQQTSLLVAQAGRVRRWYKPGLLLIGDAAHVMSPVGGVGINYAIQDAIVAANLLGPRLLRGGLRLKDLAAVQRRREWPTRLMQHAQRLMLHQMLAVGRPSAVGSSLARLMDLPPLAELRIRLIAFGGLRPERVRAMTADNDPAIDPRRSRTARVANILRAAGSIVLTVLTQPGEDAWMTYGLMGWVPTSPSPRGVSDSHVR